MKLRNGYEYFSKIDIQNVKIFRNIVTSFLDKVIQSPKRNVKIIYARAVLNVSLNFEDDYIFTQVLSGGKGTGNFKKSVKDKLVEFVKEKEMKHLSLYYLKKKSHILYN